jgi:tyrosine-protein kinase Etk/Wzc
MLHLISRGAHPQDPAALLGSERMRELLGIWRDAYDIVVIDAPPVNAATDAAVLAMLADATVLVTRIGTTHRHELRQAVIHLGQFGVAVRGLVVNGVNQRQAFYGPSVPVAS